MENSANGLQRMDKLYFWNSHKRPWDKDEKGLWTPYDLEDQLIIRNAAKKYKQEKKYSKVDLSKPSEYQVDLKGTMFQVHKIQTDKMRPIQYKNIESVKEVHRLCRYLNKHKLTCTSLLSSADKPISYQEFSNLQIKFFDGQGFDYYKKKKMYKFRAIENSEVEISIFQDLFKEENFFEKYLSLEKLKTNIIEELGKIGEKARHDSRQFYEKFILYLPNTAQFFEDFIKLFSYEGFLYKKLNEIFESQSLECLRNIKYIYLTYLASFKFCSLSSNINSINNLAIIDEKEPLYSNNLKHIVVYAYDEETSGDIQLTSLDSCAKDKKNLTKDKKIIFLKNILYTSRSKASIMNYFDLPDDNPKVSDDKGKIEVLYEITIPEYILKSEPESFLFNENISVFKNEYEVVLKENAILLEEQTQRLGNFPNKYLKKCTLLTLSKRSYLRLWIYYFTCNNVKSNNDRLDLSDNDFLTTDVEAKENFNFLKDYLINEDKSIKHLSLCYHNLGGYPEYFAILQKIFYGNNSNIISLNLSYNSLNLYSEGLFTLKNLIAESENLRELYLSGNSLGKSIENMKIIRDIMLTKSQLEYLDLSRNDINSNEENLKLLKEALIENPRLKELNLSSNDLGLNPEYLRIIKDIFLDNYNIKLLNLSNNKLGKYLENAVILKDLITENRTIEKICLLRNDFPDDILYELKILSNLTETLKVIV